MTCQSPDISITDLGSRGTTVQPVTSAGISLEPVAGVQLLLETDDCQTISLSVHDGDLVTVQPAAAAAINVTTDASLAISLGTVITSGSGEANEGQNVGGGAEVFQDKLGVALRFRTLTSLSSALLVAQNDLNSTIDFDLDLDAAYKFNVVPAGAKDGVNLTYSLPNVVEKDTMRLYRNGVRLAEDDGGGCDYRLAESGGVGSGFDEVVMTTPALLAWEQLTADYMVEQ